MCLCFHLTQMKSRTLNMIEFVDLPPNLEDHIRGCHGNHAFSRSSYLISFEVNFVSHFEGPTEQFGINLKGPMSAGYIVP